MFEHDVCIIGTGRVGLPFGLSLVECGLKVIGVDVDESLRAAVNGGEMPFNEPGYDELVASRRLTVHASADVIVQSETVIVTVGTPLHTHIETDIRQIERVLTQVAPHLRAGQLLCLRSTVAPGTTQYVKRWIEKNSALRIGETLALAFCPERIAEGKAYEELRSLPQIIGTEDELSRDRAEKLYRSLVKQTLHTNYVSAELAKLFNNIARYVNFALANQLALVADTFGANIYEIRRLTNLDYPRDHVPSPGFTAGTCLRKDFGMINEWSPYPDMLLSAWKMNEYMPAFLVHHLRQRTDIHQRRVALLGYTFKADTDDTRDSLAPKLWRYIQRELPAEVRVNDPYLPEVIEDETNGPITNWPLEQAIEAVDCVFVATNHRPYRELLQLLAQRQPEAWVADLWDVGAVGQVFYQAKALKDAS